LTMDTPKGPPRTKICSRCSAELTCGPAEGKTTCWCEELPPILPFTGEDCLCRKCAEAEVARLTDKRRSEQT
jgi:hypothetical protein